jgi:hypothetical protein
MSILKEVGMKSGRSKGALLVVGFAAVVLASGVGAQAPKGLVGTWKLNSAKSTFSPGPPPKSMTVTYSAVGADGMKIAVDVTPGDGPAQHWEMTANYDGKEYPVKGNPAADMISIKKIDDLTGESTFKKDGKVTSTNVRKLSSDGKTLTISSTGTTADGKPRKDVQVFEK